MYLMDLREPQVCDRGLVERTHPRLPSIARVAEPSKASA